MATSKPAAATPLPADVFWERALADSFGVSRSHLRKMRKAHLSASDWHMHENAVVVTASGLAKLRAVLTAGAAVALAEAKPATTTSAPAPSAPAVQPGPPESRHFVVTRVPQHRVNSPQKRLLLARPVAADFAPCSSWELSKRLAALALLNDERERPVRVRDNTNFAPGMVIEAVAIGLGMWQYRGRLPRRVGKW